MIQANNPVITARKALGMGRGELALKLGTTYNRLAALEHGYMAAIPLDFRPHMIALGVNFEELAAAYPAWKLAQAAAST